MKLIDLRSDTVTKPDKNIIEEALQAELGDDEYGENIIQNKFGIIIAVMMLLLSLSKESLTSNKQGTINIK